MSSGRPIWPISSQNLRLGSSAAGSVLPGAEVECRPLSGELTLRKEANRHIRLHLKRDLWKYILKWQLRCPLFCQITNTWQFISRRQHPNHVSRKPTLQWQHPWSPACNCEVRGYHTWLQHKDWLFRGKVWKRRRKRGDERERAGKGVGGRNDWLIGCGAERVSYRDSEKRKKGINI